MQAFDRDRHFVDSGQLATIICEFPQTFKDIANLCDDQQRTSFLPSV